MTSYSSKIKDEQMIRRFLVTKILEKVQSRIQPKINYAIVKYSEIQSFHPTKSKLIRH
jgi:hypothetical protein